MFCFPFVCLSIDTFALRSFHSLLSSARAHGMFYAAQMSSFPKGSQCRRLACHLLSESFQDHSNGHPNPKWGAASRTAGPRRCDQRLWGPNGFIVSPSETTKLLGCEQNASMEAQTDVPQTWSTVVRGPRLLSLSAPHKTRDCLESYYFYSLWVPITGEPYFSTFFQAADTPWTYPDFNTP